MTDWILLFRDNTSLTLICEETFCRSSQIILFGSSLLEGAIVLTLSFEKLIFAVCFGSCSWVLLYKPACSFTLHLYDLSQSGFLLFRQVLTMRIHVALDTTQARTDEAVVFTGYFLTLLMQWALNHTYVIICVVLTLGPTFSVYSI